MILIVLALREYAADRVEICRDRHVKFVPAVYFFPENNAFSRKI